MEPSKAFRLNKEDIKKIVKGLAIAMGGAGITYLLAIVNFIDVDAMTPLFVAVASALLNAAKVWIQGQTK